MSENAETLEARLRISQRTAQRATDELFALHKKYAALRAACEGVPDMLQVAGMLDDMDEDMISKAHALRAALASASDGAGTAAGDATAGDGDGQS